jgi:hypothetical protein
MDASRVRLGSLFDWIVAGVFLAATCAVGVLIVSELRSVGRQAPTPTEKREFPAVLPASVPARAISVPVLMLLDGKQIRQGDSLDQVTALLGRESEVGTQTIDQGPLGERLVRSYEHAGTRFILVFEPFERNGPLRVTSIYIQ